MLDRQARELDRLASQGDRMALLSLAGRRASLIDPEALDGWVLARLAVIEPDRYGQDMPPEAELRAAFFLARTVDTCVSQEARRRVSVWSMSVNHGPMSSLVVCAHGLVTIGLAQCPVEPASGVFYSNREGTSGWGLLAWAGWSRWWKPAPDRRETRADVGELGEGMPRKASQRRALLERWAFKRAEDRLVVNPGVALAWAELSEARWREHGKLADEDQGEANALAEDTGEGGLGTTIECGCEFDTCNGTRFLHCQGCGGDLCICTCGGEAECYGCDDCRPEDRDDLADIWDEGARA